MADFKLSFNFDVRKQTPLDDRLAKLSKEDLINPASWSSDNGTYYVYDYMIVGTSDGVYMLVDKTKLLNTDYSGWKKVGESTGGLTEEEVRNIVNTILQGYVPKEEGKGLSSNDYTNEDKAKLQGLNNYDDTNLVTQIDNLQKSLNTLLGGDATSAIESFKKLFRSYQTSRTHRH